MVHHWVELTVEPKVDQKAALTGQPLVGSMAVMKAERKAARMVEKTAACWVDQ